MMHTSNSHPHVIDEYLCEPLFEEIQFQSHQQNSFDTWDLTPPDSPAGHNSVHNGNLREYIHDYSRVTVNLEQRDFSPCSPYFCPVDDYGAAPPSPVEFYSPPSPVEFEELADICNDIDCYPSFEVDEDNSCTEKFMTQMPALEPLEQVYKRKAVSTVSSLSLPPLKMVCNKPSKVNYAVSVAKPAAARGRLARRVEVSPSPSLESDDPENKRHTHNVLERKRRNELKSSYQDLREEIPDLYDNDKTPTGVILNRACEYIAALQEEEASLLHGIAMAKLENARLRKLLA
jgi:hypothetical protein